MLRWGVGAKAVGLGPPPAPPAPRRRRLLLLRPRGAKKPPGEERGAGAGAGVALSLPKSVLLRSGLALFALGFVDAGYSGDWSRVGAISRDTEELLKVAAYAVVPLCLALIFSPTASQDDGGGGA